MSSLNITNRAIQRHEIEELISFDTIHLVEIMKNLGIAEERRTQPMTQEEIITAFEQNDILQWVLVDQELAGYLWREKRPDCLFGKGAAIKAKYYGQGLSCYILQYTDACAKAAGYSRCQLAVIPENGRAIAADMKQGYQIISTIAAYFGPAHPHTFRCLMEKNFNDTFTDKPLLDCREVHCQDYETIKSLTDQGYRGVRLIRPDLHGSCNHHIVFEKRD